MLIGINNAETKVMNSRYVEHFPADANHGVRQYSSEMGRFMAPDQLWEKYIGWSPYQYSMNNPVNLKDDNGKEVFATGPNAQEGLNLINNEISMEITRNEQTGKLSVTNATTGTNNAESTLLEAINNNKISLNLEFTNRSTLNDINGNLQQVCGGIFGGSKINDNGTISALQVINIDHFKKAEQAGGDKAGQNIIHETLEGYIGGRDKSGTTYKKGYLYSHNESMRLYPLSGSFKITGQQRISDRSVDFFVNGIYLYNLPLSTLRITKQNENK